MLDKYEQTSKESLNEKAVVGAADKQEHYKKAAKQPIEVMQLLLTPEEFRGFLLGNVIKYKMRKDHKGQLIADVGKTRQYHYWLCLAKSGKTINPTKDIPPVSWEEPTLF